jgi:hypothetical protein
MWARLETALGFALALGLLGPGTAVAADEELPDLEFLEYLGSWEDSDEEWLLFDAEASAAATDDGPKDTGDGAPAGKDSTELDNES